MRDYIWKSEKKYINGEVFQESIKLMDATPDQLRQFYNYADKMLYNKDFKNPGRKVILETLAEQRTCCHIELFLRFLEKEHNISRFTFNTEIQKVIQAGNVKLKDLTVGDILTQRCEFEDLNLDKVVSGCLDRLGIFTKQQITITFILDQGIRLTPAERAELTEPERSIFEVIKGRLELPQHLHFKVKPTGLTYAELRSLVMLKTVKYSSLTTDQLNLLRSKILFILEAKIAKQAKFWEYKKEEIVEVAHKRGIAL